VDSELNLIKGGGAAHVREKLVAGAARRFVVVVEESKIVDTLDWAVPTEVLPFAYGLAKKRLEDLGATVTLRSGKGKGGPVISDNGNYVIDVDFGRLPRPGETEKLINSVPGVVDNGLFCGMTSEVYVGGESGVKILQK